MASPISSFDHLYYFINFNAVYSAATGAAPPQRRGAFPSRRLQLARACVTGGTVERDATRGNPLGFGARELKCGVSEQFEARYCERKIISVV